MSNLQIASIIFGMLFSAGAVLIGVGKIIQRLSAHEQLDTVRFDALSEKAELIHADVREIRNRRR